MTALAITTVEPDDSEWLDWPPFDDSADRYNFVLAHGRIIGGIAHGRHVYPKKVLWFLDQLRLQGAERWWHGRRSNVSATVKRRAPSRDELDRIARPLDAEGRAVLPWGAKARHLPWKNRDAEEVEENARR